MIGLFDSGSGGLTVLRALRDKAPNADVVYFGDIANAPYGTRSAEELVELTRKGVTILREHGAEVLVSACNSVSTSVLAGAAGDMPFVEMSQPTAACLREWKGVALESPGVKATPCRSGTLARRHLSTTPQLSRSHLSDPLKFLLIATPATIESKLYEKAVAGAVELDSLSISDLAGAIEFDEGEDRIEQMLEDAFASRSGMHYDGIILGCTHYPLVRDLIEKVAFERFGELQIIDPAIPVAEAATKRFDTSGAGKTRFLISKASSSFDQKVDQLFEDMSHTIEII